MLDLPILNVHLQPCHEDWQQMTPVAQGHYCASCQRTVVDFTHATQSDLEAVRADSPDGRMCGRFRTEQLARPPRLRPKLRQFLVALVLVCGLGLTSQEAVGQFFSCTKQVITESRTISDASASALGLDAAPSIPQRQENLVVGFITPEIMPSFPGGQDSLVAYLKRELRYPASTTAEGKVFLGFIITKTGHITQVKVLKGINPTLDAEALRVVRKMPRWVHPPRQRPMEVSFTLPITFSHK
ncbi:energy transducer TonB [Hymenobacter sediminicola]|uniref:TonB family protein n=1 Tax=Hymenobacter sediminicola TaxID=2761579 RepID=A0A7G7W814_9BACT|nr:energy transducer TonB [Hymenobacter sediminicola]QNH62507.1 TonB family protein [Hymenobacter sediminicola]